MVLGKDLTRMSAQRRDRHRGSEMGYIFQSFNLIPYLTVRQNVALPCQVHERRRRNIAPSTLMQEVERLVLRLGLASYLDRNVKKLSTGQQQRVAIARAVIGKPNLVIADEPTSSLDADRRRDFLDLLFSICDEAQSTLIFASHDLSLRDRFDQSMALSEINRAST
jgi:putative ABC transport system ATP-binding protein